MQSRCVNPIHCCVHMHITGHWVVIGFTQQYVHVYDYVQTVNRFVERFQNGFGNHSESRFGMCSYCQRY